jgi:hypothetical protein
VVSLAAEGGPCWLVGRHDAELPSARPFARSEACWEVCCEGECVRRPGSLVEEGQRIGRFG